MLNCVSEPHNLCSLDRPFRVVFKTLETIVRFELQRYYLMWTMHSGLMIYVHTLQSQFH